MGFHFLLSRNKELDGNYPDQGQIHFERWKQARYKRKFGKPNRLNVHRIWDLSVAYLVFLNLFELYKTGAHVHIIDLLQCFVHLLHIVLNTCLYVCFSTVINRRSPVVC